jgi:hypothetical protein
MLMSWAGYRALWQLVHNPFYWEKTQHGLTRMKQEDFSSDKDRLSDIAEERR